LRLKLKKKRGIDLKGYVPYTFRHSRASEWAANGMSAPLIAELLGHASMDLLKVYCHPTVTDLAKAVDKLSDREKRSED
jgi:site-specific recombinase XerD